MTDGLRVNHAELEGAAQNMSTTVRNIERTLEDLDREISPKVSTWSGSQQEAYRAAKQTWDRELTEMKELLNEAHLAVNESNDGYRAADVQGARHFQP